jgi:hypothetical protein
MQMIPKHLPSWAQWAQCGITLGIGPHAPRSAQHRLDEPRQLQEFMLRLEESLRTVSMQHE